MTSVDGLDRLKIGEFRPIRPNSATLGRGG